MPEVGQRREQLPGAVADEGRDARGRATQGAVADEGRDARGRATQARAGMPEVEQRREQLPGAVADERSETPSGDEPVVPANERQAS
jgi:hypothetical protein